VRRRHERLRTSNDIRAYANRISFWCDVALAPGETVSALVIDLRSLRSREAFLALPHERDARAPLF
jgi:hypothetical protein